MDPLPTSLPANLTSLAENGDQTFNSSCSSVSHEWVYSFVPVYILSISVLGMALNIFVLMVFILHKKSCSVAEIYMGNLAAADLLLTSFLPFWAVSGWNRFEWKFGLAMCKIVNVAIPMNVYCSIYFLILVSSDRYLALVHPLSHQKLRRPKCAKISCVLVWILGFLLSLPKLINRTVEGFSCYEEHDLLSLISDIMFLVFGFFIPISIILFCTIKILQTLGSRFMEEEKAKRKDRKATTLVLAVLLAFLICWVPFYLIKIPSLLNDFGYLQDCNSRIIMFYCGQIFMYLGIFNSVLNPILYVIVGKKFQKKVRELFTQLNHRRGSTFSLISASTKITRSVKLQLQAEPLKDAE
ncbi:B2 bradykinin receptor-like [Cyprinodon tularosa]|uniref:B2 bradykinin receptor-like n=1 Tax=Cyprinodon tularosa TaxID=77115 RepID=UPI0018E26D5D|nr:B2 bradykinin receptor-like [Cyprinodon tularosa]